VSVPSSANAPVITPIRLARYLEKKFADDRHLRYVGVQGEVSNLKPQEAAGERQPLLLAQRPRSRAELRRLQRTRGNVPRVR
jgi:hypothetical protein